MSTGGRQVVNNGQNLVNVVCERPLMHPVAQTSRLFQSSSQSKCQSINCHQQVPGANFGRSHGTNLWFLLHWNVGSCLQHDIVVSVEICSLQRGCVCSINFYLTDLTTYYFYLEYVLALGFGKIFCFIGCNLKILKVTCIKLW